MIDRETGEIKEFVPVFVRSANNYDMDVASLESAFSTVGESRTQQQFAEEVDINTIVRRFGLTGELPKDVAVPVSGDFTDVTDFQSAMNIVRAAEEAFMKLPADVRTRFANDPQRLQEFVEDSNNLEEARKLGLAVPAPKAPEPPAPIAVRVVADPAPQTSST